MNIQTTSTSPEADKVGELYKKLLNAWNERNAEAFAVLFAEDGNVIGFDGSPMNGRTEIQSTLHQILADHLTSTYVGKIRQVRLLSPDVVLRRAVAGMVPRGKLELNPAVNIIQSLVAAKREDAWQIELFQNTPAQFHGRPELAEQLTEELRQLI